MRKRMFGRMLAPALILFAAAATSAAEAQTTAIDEGVFRVFIDGREVGTETFTIRQNGTGAGAIIIAHGRTVVEPADEQVTASLELAGAALRPTAYQVNVQGAQPQRIAGRVVGGRFSARINSPAGEMMREYLAGEGAILVDDGVAHHYYFLARRAGEAAFQVPLIIPRQSRQAAATVTPRGNEMVEIAGARVQARRLNVAVAGGQERHVWADAEGRILRVEIPAANYVAVRRAMPQ
jgi:hypothetical protein